MRRVRTPYIIVIILASALAGAIIASQLGLSPESRAAEPAVQTAGGGGQAAATKGEVMNTHLFRNIAKAENPVVVYITTQSRVQSSDDDSGGPGNDFFQQFFGFPFGGQQTQPRPQIERALGSGFIISNDGEILTNNHVVEGAQKIQVTLFSDQYKQYDAKVIGHDPLSDSALIKLVNGPTNLPTARLGDSASLEPGDWVMAIGNPFAYGHTVTVGVVSYMGRPFREVPGRNINMIQTDASINPGNSGGPLLDTNGDVVGINTAILSGGQEGGNIGIGFAVPINTVKGLLPQLRKGQVIRGYLGVTMTDVTPDEVKGLGLPKPEGVLVHQVEQNSPADRAGVLPGDVIVKFNGTDVKNSDQISQLVTSTSPGSSVALEVYREGKPMTLHATITQLHLENQNTEQQSGQAHFGLSLNDVTPDMARRLGLPAGTDGALVQQVQQDSPADAAGVQPGDVIIEVNRHRVHSAADAARELRNTPQGQTAFLLIERHGQRIFVSMPSE